MTKSILTKSLLLGGAVLAAAACSNEKLSDINPDKALENPKINITLKTPSPEGIVVKGSVEDEADERTINYLNVYIFEEGSSTNENNYTLYSTTKFTTDGSDGSIAFTQGTDANSTTTCSLDIPAGLIGQNVRVGVIANDTPTVASGTSLTNFRYVLATATLTDEDGETEGVQVSADALVGGDTKSFPMSAITSEAKELTPYGLDLSVELVRTVSRIDICNYAPDLIITSVQITNANESSRLNSGSSTEVNEPSATRSLIINPLKEYSDLFVTKSLGTSGGSVSGIPYDSSKDANGTVEEIKKLNTHRALYLYEQSSSSTTSPKVTIGYTVFDGTTAKTGEVTVSFYDGANYVPAKRNYLYTIQLGDGSTVSQGEVKATFKVAEWTEGETIDSDLVLKKNED